MHSGLIKFAVKPFFKHAFKRNVPEQYHEIHRFSKPLKSVDNDIETTKFLQHGTSTCFRVNDTIHDPTEYLNRPFWGENEKLVILNTIPPSYDDYTNMFSSSNGFHATHNSIKDLNKVVDKHKSIQLYQINKEENLLSFIKNNESSLVLIGHNVNGKLHLPNEVKLTLESIYQQTSDRKKPLIIISCRTDVAAFTNDASHQIVTTKNLDLGKSVTALSETMKFIIEGQKDYRLRHVIELLNKNYIATDSNKVIKVSLIGSSTTGIILLHEYTKEKP